jgi:hypothetical protein
VDAIDYYTEEIERLKAQVILDPLHLAFRWHGLLTYSDSPLVIFEVLHLLNLGIKGCL